MSTASLEARVSTLEDEVARLKEQMATVTPRNVAPWWERTYGPFADSAEYDQAMRLGRAYRGSLRFQDDRPVRK